MPMVPIQDFPGYSIDEGGWVSNDKTHRLIAHTRNQQGICQVGLMRDGRQYTRSVAKLVAHAFLDPHPHEAFNTPVHLNGNRSDCRADNLVWRPRWFASTYHRQFRNRPMGSRGTPVINIDTGEEFDSHWDAAEKYGLIPSEILLAAHNRTYVFPGYEQYRYLA